MIDVRVGDWAALGTDAAKLRTAVFVQEQGIAPEMEWDEADGTAVHAVAYNGMGQGVATGRLTRHANGMGKIGRMAVHRVLRGSHIGQEILRADGRRQKPGRYRNCAACPAQCRGLYRRLGFAPRGEPFEEVGIAHLEMFRML